jgi:hypothetical protein
MTTTPSRRRPPPGHRRARQPFVAALAWSILAGAVACSGGAGGGSGDSGGGGSELRGRGSGLDTVAGSLGTLPETGEPVTVVWGDLARAAEIAGIEHPDDPADSEAVNRYLRTMNAASPGGTTSDHVVSLVLPDAAHVQGAADLPAFVDDVGWSVLQVDRFIELQSSPDPVTVLEGAFDPAAITDAAGEPSGNTWIAGNGEPGAVDRTDITPARPYGQPLWISGDDTHLAITRNPESADATTAARRGDGHDALGDDPVLATLAEALDEQSAYAALLARPGINGLVAADPIVESPEEAAALCAGLLPQPTLGVATGMTDDDGPVILLALHHATTAAARDNAAALEQTVTTGHRTFRDQPWNELVDLESVETTGDGLVTIARLRPTDTGWPALWSELVQQRDGLVVSC